MADLLVSDADEASLGVIASTHPDVLVRNVALDVSGAKRDAHVLVGLHGAT